MELSCEGVLVIVDPVKVRVTEPVVMLSERVAVSVRASTSGPFSCAALALVVFPCEDAMMIVAAFTVSVCVAAFAPVAVNAPLPVTVIVGEPAAAAVI